MATWNELPGGDEPQDAETYWITLLRWFGKPFQAVWSKADLTWTPKSHIITTALPWYFAPHWKKL